MSCHGANAGGEHICSPSDVPSNGNAVAVWGEDAHGPRRQPRLVEFAALLSRRHAVDQDATIVILLTALAGALGGARLITNPLGGCLPGSLNLLVFGEGNPPGLDAMRRATATLMEVAQRYAESTLLKGPQRLRRERIQLERYAEELNAKVRKAEAAAEALKADAWALPPGPTRESIQLAEDVESVRMRLLDLALEERPWLISDGLSPKEIRELSARSLIPTKNGAIPASALSSRRISARRKSRHFSQPTTFLRAKMVRASQTGANTGAPEPNSSSGVLSPTSVSAVAISCRSVTKSKLRGC